MCFESSAISCNGSSRRLTDRRAGATDVSVTLSLPNIAVLISSLTCLSGFIGKNDASSFLLINLIEDPIVVEMRLLGFLPAAEHLVDRKESQIGELAFVFFR